MDDKTTSPVFKPKDEPELLTFPDALREIISGKRVTKLEWNNPDVYGILQNGFLMLHKADDQYYQWIISDGDLLGDDFIVISTTN